MCYPDIFFKKGLLVLLAPLAFAFATENLVQWYTLSSVQKGDGTTSSGLLRQEYEGLAILANCKIALTSCRACMGLNEVLLDLNSSFTFSLILHPLLFSYGLNPPTYAWK